MIAKHVPMTTQKKSDFAGLVMYLTAAQGKEERVGTVCITNCTEEELDTAILEVLSVQSQNTRSQADKTYHLLISFQQGEAPDADVLKAIEERVSAAIGFSGHQRVSVVHHDTDNLHVHIAINKVHPTRFTVHEPFRAYYKLAQLCDKLEEEFGLMKDNHKTNNSGSASRAEDMERHADIESLIGWIKRQCAEQIQRAQSWSEVHQVMQEHGLHMAERGNGLVIESDSGLCVKASSVSRSFSKKKLEERLGAFDVPPAETPRATAGRNYEKRPVHSSINTVELYAQYKAAQQSANEARSDAWKQAIQRKNRLIEDAKRTGRFKRAALKLIRASRAGKKLMYAAISQTLCADIAAINHQYIKERQVIYERHQRQGWGDWLRSAAMDGNTEALGVLRARQKKTNKYGNTLGGEGPRTATPADFRHDSITRKGSIIYRVGASALRDDGEKISVSRGADHEGLAAALRMAIERYGGKITVSGSAAFKERIAAVAVMDGLSVVFSDEVLDNRRRQLAQAMKTKEKKHGNSRTGGSGPVGPRPHRDRYGDGREAAVSRAAAADGGKVGPQYGRSDYRDQSNPRSAGQGSTAQTSHGLRTVQEFGVVHVTARGEVLLPGDVSGHVEHQRPEPDHGVRRSVRRPGRKLNDSGSDYSAAQTSKVATATKAARPNIGRAGSAPPPASKDRLGHLSQLDTIHIGSAVEGGLGITRALSKPAKNSKHSAPNSGQRPIGVAGQTAADKYIAERDSKRARGFEIPKHSRFLPSGSATAQYAGIRRVDGQPLALLRVGAEIQVLPVDEATVQRLSRLALGQPVALTENGTLRTKGRTR